MLCLDLAKSPSHKLSLGWWTPGYYRSGCFSGKFYHRSWLAGFAAFGQFLSALSMLFWIFIFHRKRGVVIVQ